jgi:hypothetical protein
MTLSPNIPELRALLEKATEGVCNVQERESYYGVFSDPGHYAHHRLVASCAKPHFDARDNALLFCALRNNAPALLDAYERAERLEAENERLREALQWWDTYDPEAVKDMAERFGLDITHQALKGGE